MPIFLATTGFKSNKMVQQLEEGEGGYLDIEVNGVVDIKKVYMNVRITAIEKVIDCMS